MHDRIPYASDSNVFLEKALKRGDIAARKVGGIDDRFLYIKAREKDRIRTIRDTLTTNLQQLHDGWPSFDQLSEFTLTLFKQEMDPGRTKQALGGLHGAITTIDRVAKDHIARIMAAKTADIVTRASKACIGRTASITKQLGKHFLVLNEARAVFRRMPEVDDSLYTVAIAGFPNVGKSTLLKKITGANPEIKAYAFTTKGLNVGYFEYRYNKIQCIDTPGTLNRKHMNDIERKAEITLRYLAHCIVYVFDPTEASYPFADQVKLYKELKELDKDLLVYVSKTDIATDEQIASVTGIADVTELKKEIGKMFKEWL